MAQDQDDNTPESLPAEIAKLRFEDALAELERIVGELERGDVGLEESISLYERGAALKRHCEAKLKEAELRIQKIMQLANGDVALADLSADGQSSSASADRKEQAGGDSDNETPF
ncbi:MAG: exodeoxyribonuclease VII small subunit [Alphaproteobacteria bacterium]|nr:MAG: exodeoxyribonuclease VII small subunit [Alphaproteobacteria bacterium]